MKSKTRNVLFGVAAALIIAGFIVGVIHDATPETPEVTPVDSVEFVTTVDTVLVDTVFVN